MALINTGVLFLLTAWLWSLPWFAGDEKLMIKTTSALKLKFRETPESKDYAFINVSYDISLIDKYDEYGFPVGKQVITDRQRLTRLFEIINNSEIQPDYVLCDLRFDKPTEYDSELEEEMQKLDNLIVSYHLDDMLQPSNPTIKEVNQGLSDYVIGNVFEGVYKFQLYFNDSLRLTPLIIHSELESVDTDLYGPFVRIGSRWTLNHFIMNYRLLQADIMDQEAGFNPINLGELLLLPDADVAAFLENKFVVIGDFYEIDLHESIFEITAGPVILMNAYWSLLNKDTRVNIFFFLILIGSFFFLSMLAIYPEDLIEKYIKKRYGKIKWVQSLTSFVSYLVFLVIVSIITFFFFNIHINVFLLAVYLFILEKVSNFLQKRSVVKSEVKKSASD
ncbi:MAG: CHASE2 domain-containing protein [Bacteroidia bacterium]|nr:CHASE2 domain-containing protein [Bacteroidia bacterium]